MQSSLIGKIEKAKRYAQEKRRATFTEFTVQFRGDNDTYRTSYKDGKWRCSCHFFLKLGTLLSYHGNGKNVGRNAAQRGSRDTA